MKSILLITLLFVSLNSSYATDVLPEYAPIFPGPVMANRDLGDKAKKALGRLTTPKTDVAAVIKSNDNPVCCLYVQIYKPMPCTPYWTIIHQLGGTLIVASDEDQVCKAVDALLLKGRTKDGATEYPVGALCSHDAPPN